MSKDKSIKSVLDKAKDIIQKRDDEIVLLKTKLRTATNEKQVIFKMPDNVEISNFPVIMKVHVENQKDVQKVSITNLKDLKAEVKMPDVQKVQVVNDQASKESNGFAAKLILHSVKALSDLIVKVARTTTLTIKLDDEERLKPIPVIMVDMLGRPVRQQQAQQTIIPMGGGSGRGGTPPPTSIISGRKAITVGSAVPLKTVHALTRKVIITSPASNGGMVYVGDSSVSAVSGSEQGLLLTPTGSASIDIDDVSKIYVTGDNVGDVVTYTYLV